MNYLKRFKIVETWNPGEAYCEVYQRFLGFLWWRKWKNFKTADYDKAEKAILCRHIMHERKSTIKQS